MAAHCTTQYQKQWLLERAAKHGFALRLSLIHSLPTQNAAVLRLLLAVLFTVFSRVDAKGKPQPLAQSDDALERWSELWQLGHFPVSYTHLQRQAPVP